jgi:photosystem II stability/assembly factor-like uncharacterized protein
MKKQLLLFIAIVSLHQSIAQITPTPLNLNAENGVPVYLCPVSQDTIWAGVTGVNDFTWVNIKTYARSVNSGSSWVSDTIPDSLDRGITEFYAFNGSVAWSVMGDFNGVNPLALFTTSDAGISWSRRLNAEIASGFFLNSIYFFSADSGLAMGDPRNGYFEIYTTIDGGTTWTRIPQANIPASLTNEYGVSNGYSAYGDKVWFNTNTEGRIFYSPDRGYTWSVSSVNSGWSYAGVAFSDAANGVAWRDANSSIVNDIYTTNDGGVTWLSQIFSPAVILNHVSEIKNVPGTFLFTAGIPAKLYATTDNFVSYFLIDQTHSYANTPFWSAVKMFDAGLGWAADVPQSDSAVYKLENVLTGIQDPDPAGNVKSINIFPNPVSSGAALISFTLEKNSNVIFTLSDMSGRILGNQTKEGLKGENALVYNFKNISSGLYLLNLESGKQSVNMKVVVN